MPNMNLKGEGMKMPQPGVRPGGTQPMQSSQMKLVIIIVGAVLLLAAAAFVLNKSGVVHLWGKKKAAPAVVTLPAEQASPTSDTQMVAPTEQLSPIENKTKVESPASKKAEMFAKKSLELKQGKTPATEKKSMQGAGNFTVQISSWIDKAKATMIAKIFEDAGFDSFVETAGKQHRVCIGRYATRDEAKSHGEKMVHMLENNYTIITIGK